MLFSEIMFRSTWSRHMHRDRWHFSWIKTLCGRQQNRNIFPALLYQFVEQTCTWCRFSACFTSFSGTRDSSLYKSSAKSQETSLTKSESWSLFSSISSRFKRASSVDLARKSKWYVWWFSLWNAYLHSSSELLFRLNFQAKKLAVWLVCLVSIALFSAPSSSRCKLNLLSVMAVFFGT